MGRVCTVCTHPERGDIDAALAGESASKRRIAARYAVSATSLRRHAREHLPARLVKAMEQEDTRDAIDVYAQLKSVNSAVRDVLEQARKTGDGELVLKSADRVLRQLELQAKLLGELQDGNVVNVVVSPQWLQLRTTLLTALRGHPDALESVVAAIRLAERSTE